MPRKINKGSKHRKCKCYKRQMAQKRCLYAQNKNNVKDSFSFCSKNYSVNKNKRREKKMNGEIARMTSA